MLLSFLPKNVWASLALSLSIRGFLGSCTDEVLSLLFLFGSAEDTRFTSIYVLFGLVPKSWRSAKVILEITITDHIPQFGMWPTLCPGKCPSCGEIKPDYHPESYCKHPFVNSSSPYNIILCYLSMLIHLAPVHLFSQPYRILLLDCNLFVCSFVVQTFRLLTFLLQTMLL